MAFIQYFSQAELKSIVDSFAPLLKIYEINIPKRFKSSKQLYDENTDTNNDQFPKVNLLISWVNQTQKECAIEIWSNKSSNRNKTIYKKLHNEISKFVKALIYHQKMY